MSIAIEQCNALSQTGVPQWNFSPSNPCDCGNGLLYFGCQEDKINQITLTCPDDKPVKLISALEKIPTLQRLVVNNCNLADDNPDYLQVAHNLQYIGFINVTMTPPLPQQLFTKGRFVDFSLTNPAVNLEMISFRSESPACLDGKSPEAFKCSELLDCGSVSCRDMDKPPYLATQPSVSSVRPSSSTDLAHSSSTSHTSDSPAHTSSITHSSDTSVNSPISHSSHTVDASSHPTSRPVESSKSADQPYSTSKGQHVSSSIDSTSVPVKSSAAVSSSSTSAAHSDSEAKPSGEPEPPVAESHHSLASKQDIQLTLYGVLGALMMLVCIPGLV
ncbi:hypothetical protein K493DRAFT_411381 [Basidiobolus meristosporus CBS 931.73]|uniref:Uncharacterized protein n=1 Tax=Basidiobolus meristosporus CBS 931.73 TaxID=1314790 RepID=A0A1Y1XJQ1_9FUNG|nr:hypothetical protein K493DRAFT_411381 [Basidiobolus meristosporus CBS 931.73]|eukprot:ORX85943.1 hypothetical protein K493DRAFT_411381 [Basidiobolus meristosporus CBS 931.73]